MYACACVRVTLCMYLFRLYFDGDRRVELLVRAVYACKRFDAVVVQGIVWIRIGDWSVYSRLCVILGGRAATRGYKEQMALR